DKEAFEVSGKAFAGIRSFIEESEVKTVAQARSEANRRRWEEALAQREREFASYGMPPSSKPPAEAAPGTAPDYSQAPMPQYAPVTPAAPAGVAPAKAPGAIPASEAEKKAAMPLESARKKRLRGPGVLLGELLEKLRPQETDEWSEEGDALSQNYAGVAPSAAAPTAARKEDTGVTQAETVSTPIWGSEAKPREEEDEWLPQAAGPVVEEHKLEAHPLSFDFAEAVDLDELLRQKGDTFQEHLFRLIDRKGMDDVEVYKKANIDRKHFSKIKSNVNYHPKKTTAVAFAIALGLNLDETQDLLKCAGLALAPGNVFDLIVGYCITHKVRDINEINCILFDYEQPTLGA
ncbi:MAG: hypothetical protein IJM69_04940, partial [Firmicutes bacterium]|nr:hypothetical protein [Bacillota bacterium]